MGATRRVGIAGFLAALAMAAAGCSFSDSSASISKSIGSSFGSSSSSSPGDSESAYRDDVRDYTSASIRSTQGDASFFRGLAPIAQKHGVTNWEGDSTTWFGIGEGLAKAKLAPSEIETYKRSLAGSDPARNAEIERGIQAYRPA
jgi:hypothetical protein